MTSKLLSPPFGQNAPLEPWLPVGLEAESQRRAIEAIAHARETNAGLVLSPSDTAHLDAAPTDGHLTLFTSGTTGNPKPVSWAWASLWGNAKRENTGEGSRQRWLLCYSVARFAGVQVTTHVVVNGASLVVPSSLDDLNCIVKAGAEFQVTHISGTPSLMRRLLMGGVASRWTRIEQITLGGEYASGAVIRQLQRAFPKARVTSIYASTEAGACFGSSDGKEGFPTAALKRGFGGRSARLDPDGELVVVRPDGKEIKTGDFFELRDDRLIFVGRREEIANIGGHKVGVRSIEDRVRTAPGVSDCLISIRSNAMLGHVLELTYVGTATPAQLKAWLREHLERVERPSSVKQAAEISLTSSGKVERKPV